MKVFFFLINLIMNFKIELCLALLEIHLGQKCFVCTVNIYNYTTIEANANTGEIPTTSKSVAYTGNCFTLY